tara:strand:+ start:1729 stop:2556 length:828 start_codon:yes stop_codon:yes gene_type:complete
MKLSISNIAWFLEEDVDVYNIMKYNGFSGLDIAPARICDNPFKCTVEDGLMYQKRIKKHGFEFVGMQSLLFGTQGMNIFGDVATVESTLDYLKLMVDYAAKLSIKVLVFGSPKNRIVGEIPYEEAYERAIQFFRRIGDYAFENNVLFCIEPNPVEYGADFITNTHDAIQLVKDVNRPGFKLHLDLGTIIMNDENIAEVVASGIKYIAHVHVSVPYLKQVRDYEANIRELIIALKMNNYNDYIAIEMRNSITTPNLAAVKTAIESVAKIVQGVQYE